MTYRTNEIRDKVSNLQEEIRQLDMDIEENQGKHIIPSALIRTENIIHL